MMGAVLISCISYVFGPGFKDESGDILEILRLRNLYILYLHLIEVRCHTSPSLTIKLTN